MYVIIGLSISLMALLEIQSKKEKNLFFALMFSILTLMLCFRFGQGTDYFAYNTAYDYISTNWSWKDNKLQHGEWGWYILQWLFKQQGVDFSFFVCVLSLFMMLFTYIFIKKYSHFRCLSLILLYPTYYLTYYYSGIRQGFVISIFLAFGIDMLKEKKYILYCGFVLFLSLFHRSSLLLLVALIAIKIGEKKWTNLLFFFIPIVFTLGYLGYFNLIFKKYNAGLYVQENTISWMGIIIRIILFMIIAFMHSIICKQEDNEFEKMLFSIYKIGFIISMMFGFTSLISQRGTAYFRAFESILIPLQVYLYSSKTSMNIESNNSISLAVAKRSVSSRDLMICATIVIIIMDVQLVHNLMAYISQGHYFSFVNIFNYPYISIFNKDAIYRYRFY